MMLMVVQERAACRHERTWRRGHPDSACAATLVAMSSESARGTLITSRRSAMSRQE